QSAEAARERRGLQDPGGSGGHGGLPRPRTSPSGTPHPRRPPLRRPGFAAPRPSAELPWALSRAWHGGSPRGSQGSRGRCSAKKDEELCSCRVPWSARRRGALAAPHPPGRGGDAGNWEPPRRGPVISAGPERRARGCRRFGLGWKVGKGSGPLTWITWCVSAGLRRPTTSSPCLDRFILPVAVGSLTWR
uniref:Uncharacterized protein n=1 Tax=Mustela putorius furo TaxID=9669 RepID=M3YS84_MUSPF